MRHNPAHSGWQTTSGRKEGLPACHIRPLVEVTRVIILPYIRYGIIGNSLQLFKQQSLTISFTDDCIVNTLYILYDVHCIHCTLYIIIHKYTLYILKH